MIRMVADLLAKRARTRVAAELLWWANLIAPYSLGNASWSGGRVTSRVVVVSTDEHTARVVLSRAGHAVDEEFAAQLGDQ